MAQYFDGNFDQTTSGACVIVNTPPTFSGISSLIANSDGSLTASWSAATGVAVNPVKYNIYIASGVVVPASLFLNSNLLPMSATTTSARLYVDASQTVLIAGQTYTVGVRAVDAVGNEDGNTATVNQAVTYNLYQLLQATPGLVWDVSKAAHTTSGTFGEANQGVVSISRANNLDNLDTTVSSRATQSSVNSIPTNPLLDNDTRLNNLSNLDATVSSRASQSSVNAIPTNPLLTSDSRLNNLDATISSRVATSDSRLANLDATISSRASQSSVNSIPTNPLLDNDSRLNNLDASISSRAVETDLLAVKAKTDQLTFTGGDVNAYAVNIDQRTHGVFAINGNNELTGHLWLTNGGQVITAGLGTASYQVYDNNDSPVAGLGESGISANGNGVFLITPASAVSLDPFINYRVKISIVQGVDTITSFRGFTIGE